MLDDIMIRVAVLWNDTVYSEKLVDPKGGICEIKFPFVFNQGF